MKKILFLIFTPNNSGAEFVIRDLIRNNKQITSYTLVSDEYAYKISENDIRTKYIRKLNRNSINSAIYLLKLVYYTLGLTFTIIKLQRKYKYDIIYANTLTMATYALLSKILSIVIFPNLKFMWHDHIIKHLTSKVDLFVEKICIWIYFKTIVVSNAVFNKNNIKNNKKIVLYNGVDITIFKKNDNISEQKRTQYLIKDEIVIGIFGLIIEEKGHIQLLRAINKLKDHNSRFKVFVIGSIISNVFEEKIENLIDELKLTNVIMLPFVNNINEYYNLVDIIVNNTGSKLSEALGTTILEGMSSGNIVIASNTGGNPEIIDDKIDGFLFEPDNISDLKNKIEYVADNFDNLDYIRNNARNKILKKFTIERMVDSFNKITDIY